MIGVKSEAKLNDILAIIFKTSLIPLRVKADILFALMTEINSSLYFLIKTNRKNANMANPMYSQKLVTQKVAVIAKYLKNKKLSEKIREESTMRKSTSFLMTIFLVSDNSREIIIAHTMINNPPNNWLLLRVSPKINHAKK